MDIQHATSINNSEYCAAMKAVISLEYLPSIHWFAQYLKCEQVYIERHENFVKSTGRNRCAIAGANGQQLLSIPMIGGRDHHQPYTSVAISYKADWQSNHWQSIVSAYGSTPYFEHYEYRLKPFYNKQYENLFELNLQLLQVVLKLLKAEREILFTPGYAKTMDGLTDLRSVRKGEEPSLPPYYQIFSDKNGFIPNLSIIDLLFHQGPAAKEYLMNV